MTDWAESKRANMTYNKSMSDALDRIAKLPTRSGCPVCGQASECKPGCGWSASSSPPKA